MEKNYIEIFNIVKNEEARLRELASKIINGEWVVWDKIQRFREAAGDPIKFRAKGKVVNIPLIDEKHPEYGRNIDKALLELNDGKRNFNELGPVECKFEPMDSGD